MVPIAGAPLGRRVLYALKPASWPKLLVAAVLGQGLGVLASGRVDVVALALGLVLTVLDLVFVVLLNDWGDQEVDAIKRRLLPHGCSPKTIPDEILEASNVLLLAIGAALLLLGVAVGVEVWLGRPGLSIAVLVVLVMPVLYTLPPVRLNYRGGGELLEMLGVGFVLPWVQAWIQSGDGSPRTLALLPPWALLCLASALASGLADEDSDRLGGKRTFVTAFGGPAVRQAVEGLVLGAILVFAALPKLAPQVCHFAMVLPAVIVMIVEYRELRRVAELPETFEDPSLRAYKTALHGAIWRGGMVLAVSLALAGLVRGGVG